MDRMVTMVFKILGISIVLMIVLDMSFIVADTLAVNNRVNAIKLTLHDEVRRNNCVPNALVGLFEEQLQDVQNKSNIVSKITTNFHNSITVDGVTYPPVNEANVKDYGELVTVVIQVEMSPHSIVFYKDPSRNADGTFVDKSVFTYTDTYIIQEPALRYLK